MARAGEVVSIVNPVAHFASEDADLSGQVPGMAGGTGMTTQPVRALAPGSCLVSSSTAKQRHPLRASGSLPGMDHWSESCTTPIPTVSVG